MIIWRYLVLLITILWCSFTVQNPKLRTYQMLAWYGNWLSHNVGRFYRQISPHANKAHRFCPLWAPPQKARFLSWREEVWVPVRLCGDLRAFILNLRLCSAWLILCCLLFDRGRAAVSFVAVRVAVASCAAQSRWSYHGFDRCLWTHKQRSVHCV